MGRSWSSVVSFRFCIEVGKIPQVLFNLFLIHHSQSTGMCLVIPHSCISDRVNTPAILFHFLYVLPKLLPRFSLKHAWRIHLDLLHFLTSLSLAPVGSPSGKKSSYQSNNQLHSLPSLFVIFCYYRGCRLAYTAGHLQLDQAVQLNRVLHGEFLCDGLNEAVDDQGVGLGLIQAAAHQVEELVVTDLRDGGLVADFGLVLFNANSRVGVGASILIEQERVTAHAGLGVVRTPVD